MRSAFTCFFHVLLWMVLAGSAQASKEIFNDPYVISGPGGVFYARCIPEESKGTAGTTEIFRVRKEGDEVVDRYDWYANRVVLGWSPIAGKVGVLAWHDVGRYRPIENHEVELEMYLGGKLLKKWTKAELWKLLEFAPTDELVQRFGPAVSSIVGCEQIPNTNEYVYVVNVGRQRLSFDILTGELHGK